jgi:hypothetical protein
LPPDGWLADETRIRGIRENAAVLAVLEVPEWREQAAEIYRREHPDRVKVRGELLATWLRPGGPAGQAIGACPAE